AWCLCDRSRADRRRPACAPCRRRDRRTTSSRARGERSTPCAGTGSRLYAAHTSGRVSQTCASASSLLARTGRRLRRPEDERARGALELAACPPQVLSRAPQLDDELRGFGQCRAREVLDVRAARGERPARFRAERADLVARGRELI